jgi:hypothetical protein
VREEVCNGGKCTGGEPGVGVPDVARQIDLAQGDLPDVQIVHTAHPCTPTTPTQLGEMRSCCCHHSGEREQYWRRERERERGGWSTNRRWLRGRRARGRTRCGRGPSPSVRPGSAARSCTRAQPPPQVNPVQFHPRREKRQRKRKHVKGNSGYLTVVKRVITPKTRDAIGSAKLK